MTKIRGVKFFAPISIIIIYLACTNIQTGQTTQRFYDNINGNLRTYGDLTITTPTSFSFSAMGDTHIGSSGGALMARALQMSKNDGDSFAVIAGDDSNTGIESELLTFLSQISDSGLTAFPAIGNHDIFFGGWANYKRIIGRSIYSLNAGNTHFIFLDTANGAFGEDQLHWLTDDLNRNTLPNKVVIMHFPIYIGEFSSLYKISSDEEATIFKNIMHKFGVNLVISGHYHGYGEKFIGGTRYIVTGACNNILDIGNRSGYVKVTVSGTDLSIRQIEL